MALLALLITGVQARAQCHSSGLPKLTADDTAAGDEFAYSVAIDGDLAVTGAWKDSNPFDRSGSAYVYRLTESGWSFDGKGSQGDPFMTATGFQTKVRLPAGVIWTTAAKRGPPTSPCCSVHGASLPTIPLI